MRQSGRDEMSQTLVDEFVLVVGLDHVQPALPHAQHGAEYVDLFTDARLLHEPVDSDESTRPTDSRAAIIKRSIQPIQPIFPN